MGRCRGWFASDLDFLRSRLGAQGDMLQSFPGLPMRQLVGGLGLQGVCVRARHGAGNVWDATGDKLVLGEQGG